MKAKFTYLLLAAFAIVMSLTFSSCDKDDTDEPVKNEALVEVTNGSDVTLRDLTVVHVNEDNEPVKQENMGDIAPGEKITFKSESAKIYFGLRFNDGTRVTANYTLTAGKTTKIKLDGNTVWMK